MAAPVSLQGAPGRGQRHPEGVLVVVRAGATLDADAVMAYVAERVAPYKKVREVEFIDAVPKNPSGKILRRELKARERAATAAAG